MYTKPAVYRAYSIFTLVMGIISFISSVTAGIIYAVAASASTASSLSSWDLLPSGLISDLSQNLSSMFWIISISMFLFAFISLFMNYMEFSSFFQFADLIKHESNGDSQPIKKRMFVLSPKVYKNYGSVVFIIYFLMGCLSAIILVISQSIESKAFIAVPLIPLALIALEVAVIYITYYMRYKAFGDALEVAMERDQSNPSAVIKESLRENKTGVLRGWCSWLFVCCILMTIAYIIAVVLILKFLPDTTHLPMIILCVASWIMTIINYAAYGCFYDNLAMMVERKLIKYNLIKNANKSTRCSNCKASVPGDADYCASCGTKADRK